MKAIPVTSGDSLASLADRIAEVAVELFEKYLDSFSDGTLLAKPQSHACATYACARSPEDGEVDWSATTNEIVRLVRGLGPPGPRAYTYYNGCIVRILQAIPIDASRHYEGRIPGRVIAIHDGAIDVLTGDGIVRIGLVETNDKTAYPPAHLVKSIRAHLGLRASIEVARLTAAVAALESEMAELRGKLDRFCSAALPDDRKS